MRHLLVTLVWLFATAVAVAGPPDPQVLADRIDARIDARLTDANVQPAPPADDAEFLRRVYLDLTGRTPAPNDVYKFLADTSPKKRTRMVEELLESPRYAAHSAALWRAVLVPETTSLPEARVFRAGFEEWLRLRFRANTRFDALVRELITAPISPDSDSPTPVLRKPGDANPLAFIAVKEAKPENLAAAVTRVFLGIQMECAQCHDHPFAPWTREQFWTQAAFFAGIERAGDGLFAPLSERVATRDIHFGETDRRVPARYLDEEESRLSGTTPLRSELAAWVTRPENPYFARAIANRLWGRLFGRGLVDPVDDFHDANPPSHPELLDDLATAFAESGFDIHYLIRGITRTRVYQRTSRQTDPGQADPSLFARIIVKGLTGEQLFDSFVQATGYRVPPGRGSAREQFLTRFTLEHFAEPETSIPQALALMNGRLAAEVTTLDTSPSLIAASELPGLTTDERVELLYVSTLGRRPSERELDRVRRYLDDAGTDRHDERLADVFWALLNSIEFRTNH